MYEYDGLDKIGQEYLNPDASRLVDKFCNGLIVKAVVPEIKGPVVCELGLGDLIWTKPLLSRFERVVSVEGAKVLIDSALELIHDPKWVPVHSLFEDFSPTELFDSVLASYILEHVEEPKTLLLKIRSWLKPKGRIVIVVPNALSLHRRLGVIMGLYKTPFDLGPMDQRMGHHHVFSMEHLREMLNSTGYNVVQETGFLTKIVPYQNMTDHTDKQLIGLFELGTKLPMDMSCILYVQAQKIDL